MIGPLNTFASKIVFIDGNGFTFAHLAVFYSLLLLILFCNLILGVFII